MYPPILYAGRDGKSVILIPKCGNRSIHHAVGKIIGEDEARQCDTRLAFIREPMERLKSGFSHFHWMLQRGTIYNNHAPEYAETWESWVDHILEYKDQHWRPQTETIGDFPNTLHRFENLFDVWEDYFPGFFPHIGKVTRVETHPYRVNDIKARYKEDIELWHSL